MRLNSNNNFSKRLNFLAGFFLFSCAIAKPEASDSQTLLNLLWSNEPNNKKVQFLLKYQSEIDKSLVAGLQNIATEGDPELMPYCFQFLIANGQKTAAVEALRRVLSGTAIGEPQNVRFLKALYTAISYIESGDSTFWDADLLEAVLNQMIRTLESARENPEYCTKILALQDNLKSISLRIIGKSGHIDPMFTVSFLKILTTSPEDKKVFLLRNSWNHVSHLVQLAPGLYCRSLIGLIKPKNVELSEEVLRWLYESHAKYFLTERDLPILLQLASSRADVLISMVTHKGSSLNENTRHAYLVEWWQNQGKTSSVIELAKIVAGNSQAASEDRIFAMYQLCYHFSKNSDGLEILFPILASLALDVANNAEVRSAAVSQINRFSILLKDFKFHAKAIDILKLLLEDIKTREACLGIISGSNQEILFLDLWDRIRYILKDPKENRIIRGHAALILKKTPDKEKMIVAKEILDYLREDIGLPGEYDVPEKRAVQALQRLTGIDLTRNYNIWGNLNKSIDIFEEAVRTMAPHETSGPSDGGISFTLEKPENLFIGLTHENARIRFEAAKALRTMDLKDLAHTDDLLRVLKVSGDSYVRAAVIGSIPVAQVDNGELLANLLKSLDDRDGIVAGEAARQLVSIKSNDRTVTTRLIKALEERGPIVRLDAIKIASKVDKGDIEGIKALRKALNAAIRDRGIRVFKEAIDIITDLSLDDEVTGSELLRKVKNGGVDEKRLAIYGLGKISHGKENAVSVLVGVLKKDAQREIYNEAALSLARIGSGRHVVLGLLKIVLDAAVDGKYGSDQQEASARCLGEIVKKNSDDLNTLVRALVTEKVILEFGNLDDKIPIIVEKSGIVVDEKNNREIFLGAVVGQLAAKCGLSFIENIIEATEEEDELIRKWFVQNIGFSATKSNSGINILLGLLKEASEPPLVRIAAASSLSDYAIDQQDVANALLAVLSDPDEWVSTFTSNALANSQPKDRELKERLTNAAIDALINHLEGKEQFNCILYLKEIGAGAKKAIPALRRLLEHEKDFVRNAAAEAINKIEQGEAIIHE